MECAVPETSGEQLSSTQIEIIRENLIAAMRVLKLMPIGYRDRPARLRVLWPDYNQSPGPGPVSTRKALRAKASAQQISAMEYWLDLTLRLDEDCRRIVVARACRIPWRWLEEIDGRSHTTLRKIEKRGLQMIARYDERA